MTKPVSSVSIAQIAGSVETGRAATVAANGGFADLLAAQTQQQMGAGPAGLAQVCRDELKNAGHESLSEMAVGEMTSPAEPGPAAPRTVKDAPAPSHSGGRGGDAHGRTARAQAAPQNAPQPAAPKPAGASSSAVIRPAEATAQASTPATRTQASKAHPLRSLEQAAPAAAGTSTATASTAAHAPKTADGMRVDALAATERSTGRTRTLPPALASKSPKSPIFRVEKEQFTSQVSRSLANVLARGGGKLTLRLSPQALGDVRVDLHVHQGVASASFRAENDSARELLKSRIDDLRHALEQRGVRVERLEVVGPHSESAAPGTQWGGHAGKEPSPDAQDQQGASNRRSAARSHGAPAEAGGESTHELEAEPGSGPVSSVMVHRTGDGVVLRLDAVA